MKVKEKVILTFIVLVALGVIFLVIEPLIWKTDYYKIDLYFRLFLLMFAINTFAVLRLYNSIVQNTRFSIKLRETFTHFQQVVPALERAMKNLNSTLGNVKASSDKLKASVEDNTESVEQLTIKIKHKQI